MTLPHLEDELDGFRAEFMSRVPDEIRDAMTAADAELLASGITNRALKKGDTVPEIALPDATGRIVRLRDRLAEGPVILSFYRGGWCPYCNLELRAYQARLDRMTAAGVRLVAISPQTADESLSTAEKNTLTFDVLSDIGSQVARAFGIAFSLADALRPIYARFGHALPDRNGTDDWMLPIPATFVIAPSGEIVLAHVDVDYRRRLEPDAAIEAAERAAGNERATTRAA